MAWSNTSQFSGTTPSGGADNPIISSDDLAEWMGITSPSDAQAARLQTATQIATSLVTAELGMPAWVVNDDPVTLDGTGEQWFSLPVSPVISVSSIVENGVTVAATDYEWSTHGRVYKRNWACWTHRPGAIVVTYSHGMTDLTDVASVCLTAAARVYENPTSQSVVLEKRGTYEVQYNAVAEGLSSQECAILASIRNVSAFIQ